MGLERPQHPPDGLVALRAARKRGRDILAWFDYDRNDDVAEALARRLSHDAPDGLDDIDLAVPRVEEGNGVERRHVHALGEELDVADHPAFSVGVGVGQRPQFLVAL